jgi:hypothetical protein
VLLTAADCVLLLIDLQAKLVPALADGGVVVARAVRLAEAARLLDVPVRATEQYPAGLGPTVPELAGYPSAALAKTSEMVLFEWLGDSGHPSFRDVQKLLK